MVNIKIVHNEIYHISTDLALLNMSIKVVQGLGR